MRLRILLLAMLAAGCATSSSGSGSARRRPSSENTPAARALQLNLPNAPASAGSAGPAGGSGGSVPPGATPGVADTPGAANTTREPAIRPGLMRMPGYNPSVLAVNSVSPQSDSLARGFQLYRAACASCHGEHLKGDSVTGEQLRDLTHSDQYRFGSTDQAVYRSVVYGIPKTGMANYQDVLKPEQVWDIVNFIKSRRLD